MMTEYLAPPSHIRERLEHFRNHELTDLLQAVSRDPALANRLTALDFHLRRLVFRCTDSLNAAETAAIIEQYDLWCEQFERLESSEFEDEILQTWIALPQ